MDWECGACVNRRLGWGEKELIEENLVYDSVQYMILVYLQRFDVRLFFAPSHQ